MKITLPKTLKGLSLTQANNLLEYLRTHDGEWGLDSMCEMVSIFSGLEVEQIKRIDIDSLTSSFKHITKVVERQQKNPPKEINLNGQSYVFNQDFRSKEWNAGRYIDSSNKSLEIDKHPEMIAGICYVEKGKHYGDVPLSDRAEVMKRYMDGETYIDCVAFFLHKLGQLKDGYLILNLARAKQQSLKALKLIVKGG